MPTPLEPSSPSNLGAEARYRSLFDHIDAGFCIIELKFDTAGVAQDYRFIEVNPGFERHTGLVDAQDRWMRELAPDHEQRWFDICGRVARTGEDARFESEAHALGDRWFDVHAFRIGAPGANQVALLFTDLTARKRT